MNPDSITSTTVTTFTAFGQSFNTRKEAQAHHDAETRKARVEELLVSRGFKDTDFSDDPVGLIADLGADLAKALTLPSRMGPKPKATTAATEAAAA